MASYFGEVVFPSSRAFWDDEDETEPTGRTSNQSEFFVEWLKDKPDRIKTLLFIEGDMLIDFTKECLCQDAEEVCHVKDQNQQNVCVFYRVNEEVHLCIISPRFDAKYASKLIGKISDVLSNAERTISVTCNHVTQFKSTNIPKTPSFLRMLSTKRGGNICKLQEKLLERPNIVFGVAAGVLSYAELMELPSVLYILYTDTFGLDSVSVEPLLKLFTAINCKPHDVTFTGKHFFNKGNLYM